MNRRDFIQSTGVMLGSFFLGGLEEKVFAQTPRQNRIEEFKSNLINDEALKKAGVTEDEIKGYFSDPRYEEHANIESYFKYNIESKTDSAGAEETDPVKKKELEEKAYQEYKYRLKIDDKKILAVEFYRQNEKHLARAEEVYGVDRRYIVGTIGIETDFGMNTGKQFKAFNALASIYGYVKIPRVSTYEETLPDGSKVVKTKKEDWGESFALPHAKELIIYVHRQNKLNGKNISDILYYPSSYAACIGNYQFTPNSLNLYAVGKDGSYNADPFDTIDSIYSVANYFKKRVGWKKEYNHLNHMDGKNKPMKEEIAKILRRYNASKNYGRALIEIANDSKWPDSYFKAFPYEQK
jgi:membrane-bound lytic murein transglycosylase B